MQCPLRREKLVYHSMEYDSVRYWSSYEGRCERCGAWVSFDLADCDRFNWEIKREPPEEKEYWIMALSSVKYGRVRNLGNYESERMEVEVVLEQGQTAEDGLVEAKRFVKRQLGLGPSNEDLEAACELLKEAGEL